MAERTIRLVGGSRDGETTSVDDEVTTLYAASAAPGLLDVYEAARLADGTPRQEGVVVLFEHVGTEPADGIAPEALHLPVMGREGEG